MPLRASLKEWWSAYTADPLTSQAPILNEAERNALLNQAQTHDAQDVQPKAAQARDPTKSEAGPEPPSRRRTVSFGSDDSELEKPRNEEKAKVIAKEEKKASKKERKRRDKEKEKRLARELKARGLVLSGRVW